MSEGRTVGGQRQMRYVWVRRRKPIVVGGSFWPPALAVAWWSPKREDWTVLNLFGRVFF